MKTLLMMHDYRKTIAIAKELNIAKEDYRYIHSNTSPKDILDSNSIRGEIFDRIIYDRRPSDDALAYLSLVLRDGAIITNYTHYKLTKILKEL
jgi:hypothetical protein